MNPSPSLSARICMRKNPPFELVFNLTRSTFRAIVLLYSHMLKKLALVTSWLVLTPAFIVLLGSFVTAQRHDIVRAMTVSSASLTAVPITVNNQIDGEVLATEVTDFRPFIVEKFLKGTPLQAHSFYIVEVSDKYDLDFRLIPAIAMKESGGGAAVDPASHNAWGWENGRTYFGSWEEAIETVGKTLKRNYYDKGRVTPDEIMAVYAPPQLLTGGKWAIDVNLFFSKMESL